MLLRSAEIKPLFYRFVLNLENTIFSPNMWERWSSEGPSGERRMSSVALGVFVRIVVEGHFVV